MNIIGLTDADWANGNNPIQKYLQNQNSQFLDHDNSTDKDWISNRVTIGDRNNPNLIEALFCDRCKNWIPLQAFVDFETLNPDIGKGLIPHPIPVMECPVGRTGKGGIHAFEVTEVNPAKHDNKYGYKTSMMPRDKVLPYQADSTGQGQTNPIKEEVRKDEINSDNVLDKIKEMREKLGLS